MTGILLAAILVFGIPAWVPFVRGRCSAPLPRWAFILVVVNQILQLVFVAAVGTNLIPLNYSARFALPGLLLCTAGGFLGLRGLLRNRSGLGLGSFFTAAFGVLSWLFLVSMH